MDPLLPFKLVLVVFNQFMPLNPDITGRLFIYFGGLLPGRFLSPRTSVVIIKMIAAIARHAAII